MAFCSNCGTEIMDDNRFCSKCGTPVDGGPVPQPEKISIGLAIASLICAGVGLPLAFVYGAGILFGISGLILAILAGKKGNKSGLRTAGKIISIVDIVIGCIVLYIIIWLWFVGMYNKALVEAVINSGFLIY